ncbi:serine hydrolase-domain-containing protein [Pseudoneurospora amorphoporcata]|uniref:Serine hydrolase-domain-containing protein n=1 Tax=Pseudoneurospora amorphoporcata TaxID=241081 RepID=A0AAN6SGT2_9PEZI|nr:serine hydrolase-domain-containing protein [Pseudoneurospora amorphoporcata]
MFRILIRTTTPARSFQVLSGQPSPSFSISSATYKFGSSRNMADSSAQSTPVESSSASTTPAPNANANANAPAQQKQQKSKKGKRPPQPKPVMKEVRILMLHGYTQSGPLFRAKTRALEKQVVKALAPLNLVPTLIYPTAPNRLSVLEIPGYEPSPGGSNSDPGEETELADSWAWFRREEPTWNYRFIGEGFERLAEVMRAVNEEGREVVDGIVTEGSAGAANGAERKEMDGVVRSEVIDGVIGFSQGGAMAAMLAAALDHPSSPGGHPRPVLTPEHQGWAKQIRDANKGQPLKFCVSYSGFFALPPELGWLWEPKVKTPTMHVLGSLDTVVEESRSRRLVEACEDPVVVVHPGGHFVPVKKEWVAPLVGFITACLEKSAKDETEVEE